MNTAKDVRLMALAFWLDSIEFETPLRADEIDKVQMLWNNLGARGKGMTRLPRGGVFLIQFSMGGKAITVGKISSDKTIKGFEKAIRFADMARQYFSKYRMPDPRGTLNFSVQRVTEDLKRELKLVHMLQAIEKHLLEKGSIKVIARFEEIKEALKAEGPVRLADIFSAVKELGEKSTRLAAIVTSHNTTENPVGGELKTIISVIPERLDSMKGFIEDTNKQLTALREQQAVMIEVLKLIVAKVAQTNPLENRSLCCSPIVGMVKT